MLYSNIPVGSISEDGAVCGEPGERDAAAAEASEGAAGIAADCKGAFHRVWCVYLYDLI